MRRRRPDSVRIRALLSLGLVVGLGAVGTSARWTSTDEVNPGRVTAAELHLDLGTSVRVEPESYAWTSLSATGMSPGSSAAAMLPVRNNSSDRVGLAYRVQGRATNSSPSVTDTGLMITLRAGGTVSGTGCTGGTVLGTAGTRLTASNQALLATPRALAAGAADQVCVQVRMAANTPSAVQGTTSTVVLTFAATSVAP